MWLALSVFLVCCVPARQPEEVEPPKMDDFMSGSEGDDDSEDDTHVVVVSSWKEGNGVARIVPKGFDPSSVKRYSSKTNEFARTMSLYGE